MDSQSHRIVGMLLPVGFVKSPTAMDVGFERIMDYYDPF